MSRGNHYDILFQSLADYPASLKGSALF